MDTLFDPVPEVRAGGEDSRAERPPEERAAGRSGVRPLAVRVRPRSLGEFVGQMHLLAPGSSLRTAIEQGRPHSMVLYGPPGSGKTTLARMLAERSDAAFEELSAVQAGRAAGRAGIRAGSHPPPAGGGRGAACP